MNPAVSLVLQYAVLPIAVGIALWAVTARRKDRATVDQLTAATTKAAAEGKVTEGTAHAAIELADVSTLQAHVTAMSAAFKEERESLTRRLDEAEEAVKDARALIDEMRADQQRTHRELIDMYRRDQHHARALQGLTDWLSSNMPRLRERYPELGAPPTFQPLPPLMVDRDDDEDLPRRRWYDDTAGPPPVTPDQ